MPAKPPSSGSSLSARSARVMRFIDQRPDFGLQKNTINRVVIETDDTCSMACVNVNGACVMVGNDWDFHPGCHGFDLPDFRGARHLADLLAGGLREAGYPVEVTEDANWRFEEAPSPPAKKTPRKARA